MIKTQEPPRVQPVAAVLVMLVALGVVMGGVYWLVVRDPVHQPLDLPLPAAAAPTGDRVARPDNIVGAVIRALGGDGGGLVVRGKLMNISLRDPNGIPAFQWNFGQLMTAAQRPWLDAGWRIGRDRGAAEAAGASADQVAALKKLGRPLVNISAADRQRLEQFLAAYQQAPLTAKAQTGKDLVSQLDTVADQLAPAAKQQIAETVSQIQAILTQQQIDEYHRWAARRAAPATARHAP